MDLDLFADGEVTQATEVVVIQRFLAERESMREQTQ